MEKLCRTTLEPAVFSHRAFLVNVNATTTADSSEQDIYEAARYAWRIKRLAKVQTAEVVLAIRHGVVVGAYVDARWMDATEKNFPGRVSDPGRFGFEGNKAGKTIWNLYVGKRLSNNHRLYGPIGYVGC